MKIRAQVSYHGALFHGFACNNGVRTVAGDLNEAISRFVGVPIEVTCAGRTDRGVHAVAQVISFNLPAGIDLLALKRSINSQCYPAISVSELKAVSESFDARFSAVSRTYRYQILNRVDPDPFLSDRSWHIEYPLDLTAMHTAGDYFIGEHDFASFCRHPRVNKGDRSSLVRCVKALNWQGPDSRGVLVFEISASSFCHQMVRSIVGTLVSVGLGKISHDYLPELISLGDRQAAGEIAPPHGLILISVEY